MSVLSEVQKLLREHEAGALGEIAVALAKRLDSKEEPSPAAVAKELRATIVEIERRPAKAKDPRDEIAARREARRAETAAKRTPAKKAAPRKRAPKAGSS